MSNRMYVGEFLYWAFMEPLNLTSKEMASRLNISEATMSRLLNNKQGIDIEIAIKLSYVCGRSVRSWLNIQTEYQLSAAEINGVDCSALKPLFEFVSPIPVNLQ